MNDPVFLDGSKPQPYCPGCGHPHVLTALDAALREIHFPKQKLALVTDIGCVGLADSLFPTVHTVHTLHGRSVAVAAGIAMADPHADGERVKPVVLIGDGGVGIGLLHVIHAAQLNVNVTVLVHNNLIYGMTGGQHSVLTLEGLKTTTTPEGSPLRPLDLNLLLTGAGAGFFARTIAPGDDLVPTLKEAILHPGFACVEILELCPTFATAKGGVTGKTLRDLPKERHFDTGIRVRSTDRPPFVPSRTSARDDFDAVTPDAALARLEGTVRVVVAGRAGERVQSATLLAASAACAAGLFVTVRTDNPVTQGSGFSLAELTIAPEPVAFTGLEKPDLVLVTAAEGFKEIEARGLFKGPGLARRVLLDDSLPETPRVEPVRRDLRGTFGPKSAALGALVSEIDRAHWWDPRAWEIAIGRLPEKQRADALATLQKVRASA